jgi:hypothetical protein
MDDRHRPAPSRVTGTHPKEQSMPSTIATHVVVNHLHFRDPVTDDTVTALDDAARKVVDAGALAARVLRVDDTHLVLLLDFDSADTASRISKEVGGPLMREHVVPLLARDTERSVGRVVADARLRPGRRGSSTAPAAA